MKHIHEELMEYDENSLWEYTCEYNKLDKPISIAMFDIHD